MQAAFHSDRNGATPQHESLGDHNSPEAKPSNHNLTLHGRHFLFFFALFFTFRGRFMTAFDMLCNSRFERGIWLQRSRRRNTAGIPSLDHRHLSRVQKWELSHFWTVAPRCVSKQGGGSRFQNGLFFIFCASRPEMVNLTPKGHQMRLPHFWSMRHRRVNVTRGATLAACLPVLGN